MGRLRCGRGPVSVGTNSMTGFVSTVVVFEDDNDDNLKETW